MHDALVRSRHALVAAVGAVLVTVGAAGCSPKEAEAPPTTVVTTAPAATPPAATPPAATPPGPGATGAASKGAPSTNNTNAGPGGPTGAATGISDAVNKAIHANAQLTGSRITAVVDAAGIATLTGSAQNQQQKALAEKAARSTSGVTSVKNKVQINPTGGVKASKPSSASTKVIVIPGPPTNPATAHTAPGTQGAGSADTTAGSSSTDAATTKNGGSTGASPGGAASSPPATGTGQ